MDEARYDRIRSLFLEASALPRGDRENWLRAQCGNDESLLEEVLSLLGFDDLTQDPLDQKVEKVVFDGASAPPTLVPTPGDTHSRNTSGVTKHGDQPEDFAIGSVFGRYKILQLLGEGGMGLVYMAEQRVPVERIVALKVIRPGMDTRQVIARFEAERQALAMMDHPNIAKVLDAGQTDSGRPYFVMELVKGIPISEYCRATKLTTRERLRLFVRVCKAVQHAHQKGIIHRDLKPSNILVARYDDRAVPKVIDFGVAKAVSASKL